MTAQTPISDTIPTAGNPQLADTLKEAFACVQGAIDKKAENIRVLELREGCGVADYFVICSAFNDRQLRAIADAIEFKMKGLGVRAINCEGYNEARWILLDFGAVVVHVFLDALREYYNLEGLWSEAKRIPIPAEFYSSPVQSQLN